jgi:hypothetical protein
VNTHPRCAVRRAQAGDAAQATALLAELGYPDNPVEQVRQRLADGAGLTWPPPSPAPTDDGASCEERGLKLLRGARQSGACSAPPRPGHWTTPGYGEVWQRARPKGGPNVTALRR